MKKYEIIIEFNNDVKFTSISAVNIYREFLKFGEITLTEPNIFSGDDVDNYKIFKYYIDVSENNSITQESILKFKTDEIKNIKVNELGVNKLEKKSKTNNFLSYIRVEEDKINKLGNYIGELIIAKSNLLSLIYNLKFANNLEDINILYKEFYQLFQNLDDIVFQLNETNLSIKMITLENLFNKLIRVARESSKGKKVKFIVSGYSTQIEKSVADEISDSLIHLIRNSIDHGIEPPEERKIKGKTKFGTVKLIAYSETDSVVITINDDGGGLDLEKIKQKALEKNIIQAEQLNSLNEKEIINFIFEPGFSTKDNVTEISGRGVGMDIVKNSIEKLNGIIDIKSKKNKGTTFTIRLPLSLSIIEVLMVKFYNNIISIPVSSVISTLKNKKNIVRTVNMNKVVIYDNDIIPLVTIDEVLNYKNGDIAKNYKYIIIIGSVEKRLGLLVDDILNKEEVMIKPLNKFLGKVKSIKGATILGNGDVSLILDVKNIIEKFEKIMR